MKGMVEANIVTMWYTNRQFTCSVVALENNISSNSSLFYDDEAIFIMELWESSTSKRESCSSMVGKKEGMNQFYYYFQTQHVYDTIVASATASAMEINENLFLFNLHGAGFDEGWFTVVLTIENI